MTWKLQTQLSNGLKNAKDPITNPYNEDKGGGVLTATELKEMISDLRNAKDPATNWGDNYTSTMANICDCVLTVQDF